MESVLRLTVWVNCMMTLLELVLVLVNHVQIGDILRLWVQVAATDSIIVRDLLFLLCLAHGYFVLFLLLILFLVTGLAFLRW